MECPQGIHSSVGMGEETINYKKGNMLNRDTSIITSKEDVIDTRGDD